MNDGQNGLIQPSMSSLLSLRQLERVLAWYAQGRALIFVLHSHIHLAGILARECDFYRNRRSLFSAYFQ
jgi:hypothetical protein